MKCVIIAMIVFQIGWWGGIYLTEKMNHESVTDNNVTDSLFFKPTKCEVCNR